MTIKLRAQAAILSIRVTTSHYEHYSRVMQVDFGKQHSTEFISSGEPNYLH